MLESRSLAFLMGAHPRLGGGSRTRGLDDLVRSLVLAAFQRGFSGAERRLILTSTASLDGA